MQRERGRAQCEQIHRDARTYPPDAHESTDARDTEDQRCEQRRTIQALDDVHIVIQPGQHLTAACAQRFRLPERGTQDARIGALAQGVADLLCAHIVGVLADGIHEEERDQAGDEPRHIPQKPGDVHVLRRFRDPARQIRS